MKKLLTTLVLAVALTLGLTPAEPASALYRGYCGNGTYTDTNHLIKYDYTYRHKDGWYHKVYTVHDDRWPYPYIGKRLDTKCTRWLYTV